MDNGIDLNDLPGARGRGRAGNGGLMKPRDVVHPRVHRPEIRQIPNLPEAWNRPPRFASFLQSAGEYLGMALRFMVLLTLGGAAVAAILFGGYFIIEAAVSWTINAAAALVDWILSGAQHLAKSAIEFVVGAVVGAVQFLIDGVVWVVTAAFTAVVDLVLFVIDSFIEFWAGLFTFAADLVVAIVVFVVELLIVVLLAIGVAILLGMLSPILVPTALLYLAFISIF